MATENTLKIHRLLNLMKGLYKSVEREWDEHAQKYGMTNAHMHVLWILTVEDGIKLSDLAAKGLWNLSTTQDIVNRMDKRGFVKKEKDPLDGRITRVFMTEEGKKLRELTQEDMEHGHSYKLLQAINSLLPSDSDKLMSLVMEIAKQVLDEEFIRYIEISASKLETQE